MGINGIRASKGKKYLNSMGKYSLPLFGEGFYNVGVTVCPSGRTIKNEPFLI